MPILTHEPRNLLHDDEMSHPDDADLWLRTPLTDAAEIAQRYDDWVGTYNTDLVEAWRYDAPTRAAARAAAIPIAGPVLDLGCGTGLVGAALTGQGIAPIDGVDVSTASLAAAGETGNYRTLVAHDFNGGPLPLDNATYGAAVCIGTLSYAHDPLSVVGEMCRITRPGGHVLFTHRVDLWESGGFAEQLETISASGATITWTEPQPYMPGSADYADMTIRYVTITLP